MADSRVSTFRGSHAIGQVVAKMKVLAEGLRHRQTACLVMTLHRGDLELLQRWPRAAALYDVNTNEAGKTFWRGFELRADHSPSRYIPWM